MRVRSSKLSLEAFESRDVPTFWWIGNYSTNANDYQNYLDGTQPAQRMPTTPDAIGIGQDAQAP